MLPSGMDSSVLKTKLALNIILQISFPQLQLGIKKKKKRGFCFISLACALVSGTHLEIVQTTTLAD